MPMRVKNIAAGFWDDTGFHPIRSSYDHDPSRVGEDKSRAKGKKKAKKKTAKRASKRAVKNPARKAVKRTTKKAVKRAVKRTATKKGRVKNPIPVGRWKRAKVKRTRSGDLKVLLY